jgi:hypothetical protein
MPFGLTGFDASDVRLDSDGEKKFAGMKIWFYVYSVLDH